MYVPLGWKTCPLILFITNYFLNVESDYVLCVLFVFIKRLWHATIFLKNYIQTSQSNVLRKDFVIFPIRNILYLSMKLIGFDRFVQELFTCLLIDKNNSIYIHYCSSWWLIHCVNLTVHRCRTFQKYIMCNT